MYDKDFVLFALNYLTPSDRFDVWYGVCSSMSINAISVFNFLCCGRRHNTTTASSLALGSRSQPIVGLFRRSKRRWKAQIELYPADRFVSMKLAAWTFHAVVCVLMGSPKNDFERFASAVESVGRGTVPTLPSVHHVLTHN